MDSSSTKRAASWRRLTQYRLWVLLLIFALCPVGAWYWWQRPFQVESIITTPPQERPSGWTVPWPPAQYFRREQRTVRRNTMLGEIVRHGPTVVWDQQGKKLAEENWHDGVLHGPYTTWDSTGQLRERFTYFFGVPDGVWETWDAKGDRTTLVEYERGQLSGLKTKYYRGELLREEVYRQGKLVEVRSFEDRQGVQAGSTGQVSAKLVKIQSLEPPQATAKLLDGQGNEIEVNEYTLRAMTGFDNEAISIGALRSGQIEEHWFSGQPIGTWNVLDKQGRLITSLEFHDGRLIRDGELDVEEFRLRASKHGSVGQYVASRMDSTARIEMINTRLKAVCDYLSDHNGMDIQIDEASLADVGLTSDVAVSCLLSDLDLSTALRIALLPLGLTYDYRFEQLWITTQENRKEWRDLTGLDRLALQEDSKLAAALREGTQAEFVNAPIEMIADYFGDLHSIPVKAAPELVGHLGGRDVYVRCKIRAVSLRSTLASILDQYGLTCELRDDALWIRRLPRNASPLP